MLEFLEQAKRKGAVGFDVAADDLHVDRRRQAEIQDLADNVGGQEIERQAGEFFRQPLAQLLHVVLGRPVSLVQRDLDVGVRRPERTRHVVRHVGTGQWQADVVDDGGNLAGRNDLANLALDQVAQARRLLDARAGFGAHVQLELPGIHGREEIAADERQQSARRDTGGEEYDHEEFLVAHAAFQESVVVVAEAFEAVFESAMQADERVAARPGMAMFVQRGRAQQIFRQRGHQRPRKNIRSQHREDHGFGQRHEKITRDAGQQEHRHEHDTDRQGGNEGRYGDLLGAIENCRVELLALLQVLTDVFDGDRGIVDQDTDRQRQAAEGHDVDGLAQREQRNDRCQDGERNRHRDDQRAAPAAQEDQDHQRGQAAGQDRFVDHAVDGGTHENRLVGCDLDRQVGRQAGRHLGQFRLHAIDDVERGRRAVFEDVDQHRALAVVAHDVGLRLEAVMHLCDVADVEGAAGPGPDRQVVQLGDGLRAAVHRDVVFELADLGGAGRQHQVLGVDGIDHVERRQALRLQLARVDVDHHRTELAAVGVRHDRALHRGKLGAHEAVGQVEDLVLAERFARQRQLQDRDSRRVIGQDQRRHRALRITADHGLRDGDDLGQRGGQVGRRVEEYFHHADAVVGLRLDAGDVVYRGRHGALVVRDDAAFHFLGRQAGVAPDGAHHRDVDVRKDVRRRPHDGERADNQDQQRQHDEGVRAAKC